MANFFLLGSGKTKRNEKENNKTTTKKEKNYKKQSCIKQNARKRIYTYT